MDNDKLVISDVEIKEEVIQEFDPTNFIFDEQQDDSRDGSSSEISNTDMCRSSDEEVDDIVEHICRKCNTTFQRRTSLEEHLKFCRLSSEYNLRKAEMLKNLNQIEKEAAIMESKNICFCCNENYDIESFHIGQIKCTDCLTSFKSQMSFERHIFITHSELNDFPCTICNAKLRSHSFKLHMNQHKKWGTLYACKICNQEFNCAEHLKRHQTMSICTQRENPLKCKVCKKTFFGLDNIRAHIRSHHVGTQSSRKIEFVCPICKKCLSSALNFNGHMRVHTGECPFDCDLCDNKFKTKELLRRHRRHHTGEKPYICEECHRSFGTVSNRSRHMKHHARERSNVCSICEKGYVSKAQLNLHMKTHKLHIKCGLCNEEFKTEKAFKRHEKKIHKTNKRHREAADFQCSVCLDSFFTKHHLDKHMELACTLKYKKRKYSLRRTQERTDCTICKKNFDTSATLRSHLTMVHKVDPEDYIKIDTNNGAGTAMQPKVYILEKKYASKTKNTEITNEYDSVVISSIIYKCEKDPSNEIVFNTDIDNIKIVDDDGNDLEESSSNDIKCNINTYCSSDVDEKEAKSLKNFEYEDSSKRQNSI